MTDMSAYVVVDPVAHGLDWWRSIQQFAGAAHLMHAIKADWPGIDTDAFRDTLRARAAVLIDQGVDLHDALTSMVPTLPDWARRGMEQVTIPAVEGLQEGLEAFVESPGGPVGLGQAAGPVAAAVRAVPRDWKGIAAAIAAMGSAIALLLGVGTAVVLVGRSGLWQSELSKARERLELESLVQEKANATYRSCRAAGRGEDDCRKMLETEYGSILDSIREPKECGLLDTPASTIGGLALGLAAGFGVIWYIFRMVAGAMPKTTGAVP